MTDLTVSVTYSFSAWQANNPSDPLPAQELDNQITVLANGHNALVSAVGDVRRADGNLQNGVVSLDSLDPDLAAFFNGLQAVTVADISSTAFATQAEAQAAVSNVKIMTPLMTKYTIDSLRPYVTQAQAAAGTATTGVLSPLRATQHFASRFYTLLYAYGPTTVASGSSATQVVAIPGAVVGQPVLVGPPAGAFPAGLIFFAWVSGANAVTLRWHNATGSSQVIPLGQYKIAVVRV